MHAIKPEIQ